MTGIIENGQGTPEEIAALKAEVNVWRDGHYDDGTPTPETRHFKDWRDRMLAGLLGFECAPTTVDAVDCEIWPIEDVRAAYAAHDAVIELLKAYVNGRVRIAGPVSDTFALGMAEIADAVSDGDWAKKFDRDRHRERMRVVEPAEDAVTR